MESLHGVMLLRGVAQGNGTSAQGPAWRRGRRERSYLKFSNKQAAQQHHPSTICHHMGGFDPLESTALALYGVLGIACAVSVVYSFSESDVNRYRTQQWFHLFLGSFVAGMLLSLPYTPFSPSLKPRHTHTPSLHPYSLHIYSATTMIMLQT